MKKKLLLLLPLIGMMLACSPSTPGGVTDTGGGHDTETDPGTPTDTPSKSATKDVRIICYLDYNHANESNPYHSARWYFNDPFSKADIGLTDPTADMASYPEFTLFKGWSTHPIIDSDDQLFKFGVDMKAQDGNNFLVLYGIWVSQ